VRKRLYEVIYGSVETRYLSPIQLSALLTPARGRNQSLDVTGLLLHQKGIFIQVLEGDEPVVSALYDRISRDPRHKSLNVFRSGPIQKRQFAAWSMGFLELEPAVLSRLGSWNPLLQKATVTSAANAERLRTILSANR
jgi:hypothetical protein